MQNKQLIPLHAISWITGLVMVYQMTEARHGHAVDWASPSTWPVMYLAIGIGVVWIAQQLMSHLFSAHPESRGEWVLHGAFAVGLVLLISADVYVLAKYNADAAAASLGTDQQASAEQQAHQRAADIARANVAATQNTIDRIDAAIADHRTAQAALEQRGMISHATLDSVNTRQQRIDALLADRAAQAGKQAEYRAAIAAAELAASRVVTTGKSQFLAAAGGGDERTGIAISGGVSAVSLALVMLFAEALIAVKSRKSLKSLEPYGNCSQSARDRCAQIRDVREQIEFIAGELARGAVMKNPDPKAREDFSQEYLAQVFGVRKVTAGLARDRWHQIGGTRITVDGQGEHHHPVTDDLFGGNVHDARERFSRGELA